MTHQDAAILIENATVQIVVNGETSTVQRDVIIDFDKVSRSWSVNVFQAGQSSGGSVDAAKMTATSLIEEMPALFQNPDAYRDRPTCACETR